MMLLRIALLIFWAIVSLPLLAFSESLPNPNYISYNIEDGLSNSMVHSIAQDNDGYMWFGTEDGLNRFDGQSFKIYRYTPDVDQSLSGNRINHIYLDSHNILWISTQNGLSRYNKQTDDFQNIRKQDGLSNNNVQAVYRVKDQLWIATDSGLNLLELNSNKITVFPINSNGSGTSHKWIKSISGNGHYLWVGTWGGGLNRYDLGNNKFEYFRNNPKDHRSLSSDNVYSIFTNKNGDVWVGTVGAGFNLFLPNCSCFERLAPHERLTNVSTPSFAEQSEALFIATSTGLAELNYQTKKLKHYSFLKPHELGNVTRDMRSIYVSSDGTIWIGSYQLGIVSIPKNGFGFQSYHYSELAVNSLRSDDINSLYLEDGYIWTGSVGGLFRYPISNIGVLGEAETVLNSFTLKIEHSNDGSYWLAANDGLYHLDEQRRVISHHDHTKLIPDPTGEGVILDVVETKLGDIFVANWRGGLTKLLDEKSSHFEPVALSGSVRGYHANKQIYALFEGENNHLWIGTRDGVNRYDINNDVLFHYPLQTSRSQPQVTVYYIFSHQSILYLGTSEGLYIYDKWSDSFSLQPLDLKSTFIQAIAAGSADELWLSTFNGLYKWNIKNNQLISYFYSDGLQNSEFNTKGVGQGKNGNIYFSGVDGVTRIVPEKLNNIGKLGRLRWLTKSKNTNGQQAYQVRLNQNDNTLAISYFVDDYFFPQKHIYRYRLNGNNWIDNGNNTEIKLSELGAGTHVVELQYKRSGFDWKTAESDLTINVLPHWYRSNLAFLSYLILSFGVMYLIYLIRVSSIKKKNEFLKFRVNQQTAELASILEQKKQLFANISHELRTPITLINAPIEQLSYDESLTSKQRKLIDLAKGNGKRLFNLVEAIMNLTKVEQKDKFKEKINIDDLLIRYSIAFEPLMEQKDINFNRLLNSAAIIDVDKDDIISVLENLLSNALKYTSKGGWVNLSSIIVDGEYQLTIENKHVGLSKIQSENIFNRFERLGQSDSEQGFGLGLTLIKEICTQNNWDIICSSNQGSVKLTLAVKSFSIEQSNGSASQRQIIELGMNKKPRKHKEKQSILLVEDNDELRSFLSDILSDDYKVIVAINGQNGLQQAIDNIPDLIISDVMMPVMDGFELATKLSEHDHTCHIPVIMLTAKADELSMVKGLELGAIDYITKPFEARQFIYKINNTLSHQKSLLLAQLKSDKPTEIVSERDQKFIERLTSTIEKHYMESDFTVERLVDAVAMSERQLQRKLKALFNQTPAEYIRNYRLIKAKTLLLEGKTISFVSDSVGFNSASYFSRSFRFAFGQSPKEYINQTYK